MTARSLLAALVLGVLLTQDWVDLQPGVSLPLPGGRTWHLNAPQVDLLALGLLPFALLGRHRLPHRPPLPGPWGYALFLLASLASLGAALAPGEAIHHLVRKPLFVYVVYGWALAWAAGVGLPRRVVAWGLWGWLALTAALSLGTSVVRLAEGQALAIQPVLGLTSNHKTLAVAIAGGLPLALGLAGTALPGGPTHRLWRVAVGVALLAILASASRTAWISGALAVGWFVPARWPLGARWRLALPALALALALAWGLPMLVGEATMADANRSRHSLDLRAWELFRAHPFTGSGSGMNVLTDMTTSPHSSVNGLDAHGVVQKVASETGILGLAGWTWFALSSGLALRRAWRDQGRAHRGVAWGAAGTWATLHTNLLLSTEAFSSTHWVVFGVAWGLAHSEPRERP